MANVFRADQVGDSMLRIDPLGDNVVISCTVKEAVILRAAINIVNFEIHPASNRTLTEIAQGINRVTLSW